MANRPRVTILVGSLRAGSVNRAAAEVADEYLSDKADVCWLDPRSIPVFDEDVEALGDPAPVDELKQSVLQSQMLLIFTPEYNLGVPAVTKNTLDWLSRPFGNGTLIDRVVGIAAVGPSSCGGENAREDLLRICGALTERLFPKTLGIPGVFQLEDGRLPAKDERAIRVWLDQIFCFNHRWLPTTN